MSALRAVRRAVLNDPVVIHLLSLTECLVIPVEAVILRILMYDFLSEPAQAHKTCKKARGQGHVWQINGHWPIRTVGCNLNAAESFNWVGSLASYENVVLSGRKSGLKRVRSLQTWIRVPASRDQQFLSLYEKLSTAKAPADAFFFVVIAISILSLPSLPSLICCCAFSTTALSLGTLASLSSILRLISSFGVHPAPLNSSMRYGQFLNL